MAPAERIKRLQTWLRKEKLKGFIVDAPIDLFYLTGQSVSLGRLLVLERKALFFVDGRYFNTCQKSSPYPVYLTQGYGKKSVFAQKLEEALPMHACLGFDQNETSYGAFLDLKKLTRGKNKLVASDSPVKNLRAIKDQKEIRALKRAAALGSKGFDFVVSSLKEGITEKEMVAKLKIFWLEQGGEEVAFSPIIAFGAGSGHPHYHPSSIKLKKGNVVLIDIGVVLGSYHSDMTRTFFFGTPHPKMLEIHHIVKAAQAKALSFCKPGVLIAHLEKAARDVIEQAGFGKYYPHSLGHGIGLETHEYPFLRAKNIQKLLPGMVVTIEPGIYLPSLGGVRLEDTIVITDKGYTNLTKRSI